MPKLAHKHILLTQPQPAKLHNMLLGEAAELYSFPLICTVASELTDSQLADLQNLDAFDWLIFTSKNGVRYFAQQMQKLSMPAQMPKIAVIGQATADYATGIGYEVDYINNGNTSINLLAGLQQSIAKGQRVLALLGNLAPDTLANGLAKLQFTRIDIYKTVDNAGINTTDLQTLLASNKLNAIVLTSPSAVERLHTIAGKLWPTLNNKCVCIGSITANKLSDYQHNALAVAAKPSAQALCYAILTSIGK